MYTLQLDQNKVFECSLKVQGASLNKSKVSLVVEHDGMDLRFRGEVNEHGKVTIPIQGLSNVLKEGVTGQLYLEVIADNTYFVPFKSAYITEVSKKVSLQESVEIKTVKPVVEAFSARKHAAQLVKIMKEHNVSLFTEDGYDKSLSFISEYMVDNKITDEQYRNQIVNVLMATAAKMIRN